MRIPGSRLHERREGEREGGGSRVSGNDGLRGVEKEEVERAALYRGGIQRRARTTSFISFSPLPVLVRESTRRPALPPPSHVSSSKKDRFFFASRPPRALSSRSPAPPLSSVSRGIYQRGRATLTQKYTWSCPRSRLRCSGRLGYFAPGVVSSHPRNKFPAPGGKKEKQKKQRGESSPRKASPESAPKSYNCRSRYDEVVVSKNVRLAKPNRIYGAAAPYTEGSASANSLFETRDRYYRIYRRPPRAFPRLPAVASASPVRG